MHKYTILGSVLGAAVLAACGQMVPGAPQPSSTTLDARRDSIPSVVAASCVPASLKWCNQLRVKGELVVTDPPYDWNSCTDPSAPGCPSDWQTVVLESQDNHSFQYKGRSANFDENFTVALGGLVKYSVGTTAKVPGVTFASANVDGGFAAYDTLTVTSKSKRPANAVAKLLVTITVIPAVASVGCDRLGSSDANLNAAFYWPASQGDEQPLYVLGECSGGAFVYKIADGLNGTEDSGFITATIGKTYRFGFAGIATSSSTAESSNQSKDEVNTVLSGRAILDIKAVTPGTSFTTGSRFEYDLSNAQ